MRNCLEAAAQLEPTWKPFKNKTDVTAPIHWVDPKVTCRVRFLEWTQDGLMRHTTIVAIDPSL